MNFHPSFSFFIPPPFLYCKRSSCKWKTIINYLYTAPSICQKISVVKFSRLKIKWLNILNPSGSPICNRKIASYFFPCVEKYQDDLLLTFLQLKCWQNTFVSSYSETNYKTSRPDSIFPNFINLSLFNFNIGGGNKFTLLTVHISNSDKTQTMRWGFCRSKKERMQMALQWGFVLWMGAFPGLKAFVHHWIVPLSAGLLSRWASAGQGQGQG